MKNNKIKVLWFSTPLLPRYGVMNIIMGWAEEIDFDKFEITLASFSQDEKELAEKFSKFPEIKIVHLPNLASFKYFYVPQIIHLNRLFKKNNFDIIHSIFIQADILGAILKWYYRIPIHVSSIMGQLISSVSGRYIFQKTKRFTYEKFYSSFCSRIDCFFPITLTSINQIKDVFNFNPRKVEVIYSGVPIEIRPRKSIDHDQLIIGAASQLIYEKGLDILIRALPIIHRFRPNAKILIAGEGPQRTNLEELSKELGVDSFIEFIGFCSDMPNFMSNLDIFIFPARPSYDGLPRVILEAMIQKTPVIATNTPEIAEILNLNGQNGELFEVENHIMLAEKVKIYVTNPILCNQFVENAFRMANDISVKQNVAQIQNTYIQLLTHR